MLIYLMMQTVVLELHEMGSSELHRMWKAVVMA